MRSLYGVVLLDGHSGSRESGVGRQGREPGTGCWASESGPGILVVALYGRAVTGKPAFRVTQTAFTRRMQVLGLNPALAGYAAQIVANLASTQKSKDAP